MPRFYSITLVVPAADSIEADQIARAWSEGDARKAMITDVSRVRPERHPLTMSLASEFFRYAPDIPLDKSVEI